MVQTWRSFPSSRWWLALSLPSGGFGVNLPSENSAKFNKYVKLNGDIECGGSVGSVVDGEDVGLSASKSEAEIGRAHV